MNKSFSYSYGENDVITVMNMLVGENGEMNNLILTEVPEKETLTFLEKYDESQFPLPTLHVVAA